MFMRQWGSWSWAWGRHLWGIIQVRKICDQDNLPRKRQSVRVKSTPELHEPWTPWPMHSLNHALHEPCTPWTMKSMNHELHEPWTPRPMNSMNHEWPAGRALSFSCTKSDAGQADSDKLSVSGFASKRLALLAPSQGTYIARSDANGEDLEDFAGAGLYDRWMASIAQLNVLTFCEWNSPSPLIRTAHVWLFHSHWMLALTLY